MYCTIGYDPFRLLLLLYKFPKNFHLTTQDNSRAKKLSDFWQLHNVKDFGESQQNETKKLLVYSV